LAKFPKNGQIPDLPKPGPKSPTILIYILAHTYTHTYLIHGSKSKEVIRCHTLNSINVL